MIMTSYQELTAEGESSPLFTGCCRAKEVINLDPDCRTHPELCSRDEEGRLEGEVASGFNSQQPCYLTLSDTLTLCSSLHSPPPPLPSPGTVDGFTAPACPHSSRVPWRRRAQGSPGRGYCASNCDETGQSGSGSPTEQIQICSNYCPGTQVDVGSSATLDCNVAAVDVNRKTFEWMRVKRSQHRAGEFLSQETEHGRRERATLKINTYSGINAFVSSQALGNFPA